MFNRSFKCKLYLSLLNMYLLIFQTFFSGLSYRISLILQLGIKHRKCHHSLTYLCLVVSVSSFVSCTYFTLTSPSLLLFPSIPTRRGARSGPLLVMSSLPPLFLYSNLEPRATTLACPEGTSPPDRMYSLRCRRCFSTLRIFIFSTLLFHCNPRPVTFNIT